MLCAYVVFLHTWTVSSAEIQSLWQDEPLGHWQRHVWLFFPSSHVWNLKTWLCHSSRSSVFEGNGRVFQVVASGRCTVEKIGGLVMRHLSWDQEVPVPHWLSHQVRKVVHHVWAIAPPLPHLTNPSPKLHAKATGITYSFGGLIFIVSDWLNLSVRTKSTALGIKGWTWEWWVNCDWQIWHLSWFQTFKNFCHMSM